MIVYFPKDPIVLDNIMICKQTAGSCKVCLLCVTKTFIYCCLHIELPNTFIPENDGIYKRSVQEYISGYFCPQKFLSIFDVQKIHTELYL